MDTQTQSTNAMFFSKSLRSVYDYILDIYTGNHGMAVFNSSFKYVVLQMNISKLYAFYHLDKVITK